MSVPDLEKAQLQDAVREEQRDDGSISSTPPAIEHRPSVVESESATLRPSMENRDSREKVEKGQVVSGQDNHAAHEVLEWEQDDPEHPHRWSTLKRWTIFAVVAASSTCATCTSSVVTPAFQEIEAEFGLSTEVATLALSIYALGLSLGPALLGPLSEFFGRRRVFLGSFGLFVICAIPVALSTNYVCFLIFRFLAGVLGSAFLSVSGGSIADLFPASEIYAPMFIFTAAPFFGPCLGPIIGSAIVQTTSWRWIFRVMLIWSAVQWILIYALTPETFAPTILSRRAARMRGKGSRVRTQHEVNLASRTVAQTVRTSVSRIFVLMACEPMLLLLCIWSALLLAILYCFFEAFPIVFGQQHGFNVLETGLSFSGLAVGIVGSLFTVPFWSRRYRATRAAADKAPPPEARLDMAQVGACLSSIGLIGFACTTFPNVHWIAPEIFCFGVSLVYIYTAVFSFTTDVYGPMGLAASALSANAFLRGLASAAFPLFTRYLYTSLGTTGASGLLAGLTVLMLPLPWVFAHYGPRIRARSTYSVS